MAKNNYEVFSAEINFTLKGIEGVLKEIKDLQKELNATVKTMSKSFVLKADLKAFQELLKTTKAQTAATKEGTSAQAEAQAQAKEEAKAKAAQKKANDDFNESLRRSKVLLEENVFAQEKTGVDALNASMSTLKGTMAALRNNQEGVFGAAKVVQKGFEDISASTSNIRRGLDIIFADTGGRYNKLGQTALGLRTAIFGVKDASDVTNPRMQQLYNILDRVTNSTVSASKATRAFAQQAIETSDRIVEFNNDMVASLDSFRQMARGAGLNAANQLARLSTRFGDAAKQVRAINNELLSGNMAKAQSETAAYTKAVRNLEQEFERLNKQGIVPTEASLAKLRAQISSTTDPKQRAALQEQLKQQEALKQVYDETAKAVDFNRKALQQLSIQTAAAANNSKTAWEKFKGLLGGTVENFKKNREQAKGMGDSLFLTGKGMDHFRERTTLAQKSMEGITKTASVFKDVMLGTFAGNILFAGISSIGRLLTDTITAPLRLAIGYVSSLKDEFIAANNTVQNFDVTLKQMLTGFDQETILKAMQGANEFIRKVIAKTPFELATGQAAFQQLLTGGLDPREWLMPAADAAAAFNKPMEQLIFAIQRLKAGSKGIGIDMIRDFGIPVQQVGQWINTTTGQLASFQDVNSKSKEELEAAGYAWQQWKFNAQGALEQNPSEAINILNGYLQQNAVVAGASAARSRTLTGVLSNLKDAVTTLLTAFGQPIFKAVTDILGDIYNVVNELMTVLEPFAKLIGEGLAKTFQEWWSALTGIPPILDTLDTEAKKLNETLRIDRFKEIAKSIMTYLKPALSAILLFVRGDWSRAWGVFLDLAKKAIQGVGKFLQTTGRDAFKWGVSFVTMIAKGLASAAKSVLSFAVKSIASTISSFLKPGSPPKEGPLKTIDQWGKGLIKTFGEGFKSADFSFMQEALAPIKDFFVGKGQTDVYSAVRDTVASIIQGINKTGRLDEGLWAKVEKRLGGANKEMAAYLRAELQLKAVAKEYQDAEANGFISQELEDRLDAAQTLVAIKQEELALQEQVRQAQQPGAAGMVGGATDAKKQTEDELKLLKRRKEAGLITEQEYLTGVKELRRNMAEELVKAGKTQDAKNILKGEKKLNDSILNEQYKMLYQKKKLGLVTEEEFLQQVSDLNKQAAEEALARGDVQSAKELIAENKGVQKELEAAQLKAQKEALEKQLQQELRILERKKELGLITEQEYQEAKVKLYEGYVDQVLALDPEANVEQVTASLKTMQEELKKATEIPLDKPQDLLADFASGVTGEFKAMIASIESDLGSVATSTWEDLKKTFGETFTPVWDELKNEISTSLSGLFGEETQGGFFEGLKGMVSKLWEWFAGAEGPLANLTQVLNQLSTSFLAWADGEGKELLGSIGLKVGETIKNGLYGAFGIATSEEGATTGNFIVTLFKTILSAPDAITGLFVDFLKGVFNGLFGEGLAAWQEVLRKIFDPEIGFKAIGPLLAGLSDKIAEFFTGMSDSVAGTLAEWAQKIKDVFYDLYVYLVGASIVPDTVNAIIKLFTVDLVSSITEFGITEKISSVFDGLQTTMTEAGTNLVNNLSTGMNNAKATLDTTTGTIAQSVRDWWPFSPAKKGPLSQLPNWTSWLTDNLPPAIQTLNSHFQGVTNLAQNMAVATTGVFKSMVQSVGQMTGVMVQNVNQASDTITTKMMSAASAVEEATRLSQPLGSGFGNYGKGGGGKSIGAQGGIVQAWKNFFNNAKAGKLPGSTYSSQKSSVNSKGKYIGPQAKVPKFAKGSWDVPRTGIALIHKGEMVIPQTHAERIRNGNGGNNFNDGAFRGAFPNVKNASDARGFLEALDKLTKESSLKGQVV